MDWQRLLNSFVFAARGIGRVISSQQNMQIHLAMTVFALLLLWHYSIDGWELAWVISAIFLVLCLETINSAVEWSCDRIGQEYHPLVEKAKDAAAGAVLMAALHAVIAACIVFSPRIFN